MKQKSFWVFSSGPVGDNPEWIEPPKIAAKVEELGGREHVVFGGCLPPVPKNFVEKAMVEGTPKQFRDRRDWRQIREWAHGVADALVAVPS